MAIIEYGLDEKVAVITMNDGENRFNPPFFEAFLTVLDEIEKGTDSNALVVTSSHDKIFCNGFDLDWMDPLIRKNDKETLANFFYTLNKLLKRILLYPMPTVAAISGHVFGG
ncbi:MAG: enoyl-CoA hydratase/isomerase family protein, partial [Thermodesulfobacteriota bacterium]|nr:enoyl-CoA hydratase/isomerase family protein [Thermodesulfobacteriota bacterium]